MTGLISFRNVTAAHKFRGTDVPSWKMLKAES
jgi:hypothetical protein